MQTNKMNTRVPTTPFYLILTLGKPAFDFSN